jgi:hypothetical protein
MLNQVKVKNKLKLNLAFKLQMQRVTSRLIVTPHFICNCKFDPQTFHLAF